MDDIDGLGTCKLFVNGIEIFTDPGNCSQTKSSFNVLVGWSPDTDYSAYIIANDISNSAFTVATIFIPSTIIEFVSISETGFTGRMGKYLTTNAQYAQYLNSAKADGLITIYEDNVYAVNDTSHSKIYFSLYPVSHPHSQITYSSDIFSVRSPEGFDMSDHPVVVVSFYGATAFCNYYGYRLPNQDEWEAVADYDGSYIYGCGETINPLKANYGSADPLGLLSGALTTPVDYYEIDGRSGPFGYGMCDMAGNLWEWTTSKYDETRQVIRGGSWENGSLQCTVSERSSSTPSGSMTVGFRVCR